MITNTMQHNLFHWIYLQSIYDYALFTL